MSKIVVFDHDGTLVDTGSSKRKLYPGIEELVEELKKLDIKLFVWTSRPSGSAVEILKSLGIIGAFEEVYGGNELYPKPDARGIKELVGKNQVIMIGDTYMDMIGGTELGAYCLGACWDKESNAVELRQFGAKALAMDTRECFNLIKKVFA